MWYRGIGWRTIANHNEPHMVVIKYDFRDRSATARGDLGFLRRIVDAIEADAVSDPGIARDQRLRAIDALRVALNRTQAELKSDRRRRTAGPRTVA
jgi:hypothetical protein